jgi:hypothetical protein
MTPDRTVALSTNLSLTNARLSSTIGAAPADAIINPGFGRDATQIDPSTVGMVDLQPIRFRHWGARLPMLGQDDLDRGFVGYELCCRQLDDN